MTNETAHRKERARLILERAIANVKRDAPIVMTDAEVMRLWGICGLRETATAGTVMRELYDSEINVQIRSLWDAGWIWDIGDAANGFVGGGQAEDWDSAVYELAEAAATMFPESQFAMWWVRTRTSYWPVRASA